LNFSSFIGHTANKELLKKMIKTDRLPHALLFTGPEGIGKKLAAFSVAAALNCSSLTEDGACGECVSCLKLKSGNQPLIRFVGSPKQEEEARLEVNGFIEAVAPNITGNSRTEKINIQQIREVIREASLKPYGSGKKVFVVDDAAGATVEAANCLLKVLEEPPEKTYFILLTSKEVSLLPTIVSRCQKFVFNPLSDKEMRDFAESYFPDEKSREKASSFIGISGGSPGKLLRQYNIENILLEDCAPEEFFNTVSRWCSDGECGEKLEILLEYEAEKLRKEPDPERYKRVIIIEEAIESLKKNANRELAVSNMFLKLGALKL